MITSMKSLYPLKVPQEVWNWRTKRMAKLCSMNAPIWVVVAEALLLLRSVGLWRCLWFDFRLHTSSRVSAWWFIFWNKTMMRRNNAECDEILDRKL